MMDLSELSAAVEKLRYQISILAQAVDYKKNPVEALILEMDWDARDLDAVHDIFEKWDKHIRDGLEIKSGSFEADFNKIGIGYQRLKSIILSFYRSGQWSSVCEAYVDSFGDHPSMEYHSIMKRERD